MAVGMSEAEKVARAEMDRDGYLVAYSRIPYALMSNEVDVPSTDILNELADICKYYKVYKRGASFSVEGTNGDYVPATLRYKMSASLINKEARFLFGETPDIVVEAKGNRGKLSEEVKNTLTTINDLVKTVLDRNKFEDLLIKAAKDCFIGKRVAGLVNFNEEDGVTITFLPSTQFVYETKGSDPGALERFVCFIVAKDSRSLADRRIFKKKYEMVDGVVFLEEVLYNGAGEEIEVITERQEILLDRIPAVVIVNDGLLGESGGESEIEILSAYESWYSRLSNADIDAQRQSMNPIKYVRDVDSNSTKNLPTKAGAFWELGTDQNLEKPSPAIGTLEPQMNYSGPLKTTLDRIHMAGYNQVDMPDVTMESMQGVITSGKALKAIYWPLIVRCKEKMKVWGPQLRQMVEIIISGALVYPDCVSRYIGEQFAPIPYEVSVVNNIPLPEDEIEEKNMDLAEVEARTMSRKTFMKKWRGLTDDEVQEELEQIALERQTIEDSAFDTSLQ